MVDGMDYQQHLRVEADRLHTRRLPTRGLHPHPSKGGGGSIPCPRSRNFTPRKARDPYDEPRTSQAEFTLSWDQYRKGRINQARIDRGRQAFVDNRALLDGLAARFPVPPRIVVAIWGL